MGTAAERTGRILVVEDEARIAAFISRALDANGFDVTVARTGLGGLRRLQAGSYALVILDLLLPDLDGYSVLHSVMDTTPEQQVIVLSAVGDTQSKVRCLELGACDYIAKPFELAELLARVRIRLDKRNERPRFLRSGSVRLDCQRRVATLNGSEVYLSAREFVLLEYLMQREGGVATRSELLEQVWEYSFDPGTNVVDVCIARLRHKLGGSCIETVRNVGYCFVGT